MAGKYGKSKASTTMGSPDGHAELLRRSGKAKKASKKKAAKKKK